MKTRQWGVELGVITVRCGRMMQDVEHASAVQCRVKCGVMRDVVACINVANIKRNLKCGVEYLQCGVMWHVSNV